MGSQAGGVNAPPTVQSGTVSTSFPLDGARVRFAGDTNIGRKRDHNEDSIAIPETGERLAIVCDGMGGHASGEVASRLAVELIVDHFTETGKQQILTWPYKVDRDMRKDVNRMVTGIMLANLEIWERSQREPRFKGMGTTCVALYFLDDHLIIGHVGDSRCYRVRGTELTQLTEDHSLINDYIRMKRVTPEEAENWPHKNVIVRALGMKESVQVDIITQQPRIGDTYLLCSDGLTGMIKDDQIQHVLMSEKDLDRAAARLIQAANEEGGVDNISCVIARVEAS